MNRSRQFSKTLSGLALLCIGGIFLASCVTTYREKMYAEVLGFNDDVIPKGGIPKDQIPYDLRYDNEISALGEAIYALPSGENTAAFYALDIALDRVAAVQKNKNLMEGDPNTRYYIVFFTDGLDNISTILAERNRRGDYASKNEYAAALQEFIQRDK